MKKGLFFIVIMCTVLVSILGCNKNTNLAFSKENLKSTNKKVKVFMDSFNDKDGIYLYQFDSNYMYLFLNGYNTKDENRALYFTDIKMEVKDETFIINFNEKSTDDYKNKDIANRVLYKIKRPKNIDTIKIYKNGQETHFDAILS